MTTILFATDFSEHAEIAGRTAHTLARLLQAKLVCMHAGILTEARPDAYELASGHIEGFRQAFQEDLARRRQRLSLMAEQFATHGVRTDSRLVHGSPVHAICETAQELDAALVIMGSHGRTGFKRVLLGSVAERVVRLCDTSVLVARAPVIDDDGFRRVLVPTDFSQVAEVALDQAATLTAADASIDLLHCWNVDELPESLVEEGMERGHGELTAAMVDTAGRLGKALVDRVAHGPRKVEMHLLEERATPGIHKFMEENAPAYDLIAVGTHGRGGLERLLIGSVAESTVRYAPCSVLVSRARS